jgi:hypothetical protein
MNVLKVPHRLHVSASAEQGLGDLGVKNKRIRSLQIDNSVIVSNEGVFYKFIMQIKIDRFWTTTEILNQSNAQP